MGPSEWPGVLCCVVPFHGLAGDLLCMLGMGRGRGVREWLVEGGSNGVS